MYARVMTMFTVMVAAMAMLTTSACAQEIPPDSVAGVAIGVEELSTLVEAIVLSSERTEEGQLDLLAALSNPDDELTVR